jgi:predicted nucleic acid-binding protein
VDVDDGGSHGLAVALEMDAGAIVRDDQWVEKGSI